MTNECRLCQPLECAEWHGAAQRVHATLVPRYWAEQLDQARDRAKALHKAHRKQPDYRVDIRTRQAAGAKAGARRGGRATRAKA